MAYIHEKNVKLKYNPYYIWFKAQSTDNYEINTFSNNIKIQITAVLISVEDG